MSPRTPARQRMSNTRRSGCCAPRGPWCSSAPPPGRIRLELAPGGTVT
ncbi:hypothetical protein D187_002854 [Cystobacter fuscus DSM 2262]|uniref:Uncharacterized protein n=1 Tax=Cystobacter fuscus (strain ATCC 25194 / DSM 2262 / NBRC 100088 / M29) TaxID=1242864 RepID=S9QDD5_CYSF2|nr:hypothetical protein D187_002854 [Cystobacter fuscus DSM 2262]